MTSSLLHAPDDPEIDTSAVEPIASNEPDALSQKHFLKHCEIAALLVNRSDRHDPSVKHHVRSAIREASNHVRFGTGKGKQSARYMSAAAQAQMEAGDPRNLVDEHAVPVSRMNQLIYLEVESNPATEASIAKVIRACTVRAVITKAEDERLRALGLTKSMVDGSQDPMARYAAAGIELEPNRYSELLKGASSSEAK